MIDPVTKVEKRVWKIYLKYLLITNNKNEMKYALHKNSFYVDFWIVC